MPRGPGKYDAACARARRDTDAAVCLLVVLGGREGDGFSAQFVALDTDEPPEALRLVPRILRQVADEIEAQQKAGDS
jgi:hypothetical protein